jgi:hypothetical protein
VKQAIEQLEVAKAEESRVCLCLCLCQQAKVELQASQILKEHLDYLESVSVE